MITNFWLQNCAKKVKFYVIRVVYACTVTYIYNYTCSAIYIHAVVCNIHNVVYIIQSVVYIIIYNYIMAVLIIIIDLF